MEKRALEGIRAKAQERDYRITLHAARRMVQRHISVKEIEEAVLSAGAEVVEDYLDDPRSPSCLILGTTGNSRPLHIQCTYPPYVSVVTAYEPRPEEWSNFRVRKGVKT